MTLRYSYALHEHAAAALLTVDDANQAELLRFFDALARDPERNAGEVVVDETGRQNAIAYSEHFRVIYWPDHAVKEIRILDVRRY